MAKKSLFILFFLPIVCFAQMTSERTFIAKVPTVIYKPSGFEPTKKYTTVLFLHGKGEMGNGTEAELISKIANSTNQASLLSAAEKYKWIVIAPQLVQSLNNWIPGWTNNYLQPVYDYIVKSPLTDIGQIIVTGLSLGGGGTWVAITGPFAPYVASAIPICGTPEYNQDFSVVGKNNIAVWAFHAKDDNQVGVGGTVNIVNAINKAGASPSAIMTLYETGQHWIWGKVYSDDNVYKWASAIRNDGGVIIQPPTKKVLSLTYFTDGSYVIIYDDKSIEFKK